MKRFVTADMTEFVRLKAKVVHTDRQIPDSLTVPKGTPPDRIPVDYAPDANERAQLYGDAATFIYSRLAGKPVPDTIVAAPGTEGMTSLWQRKEKDGGEVA